MQKLEVVRVLERYSNGAEIGTIAEKMGLTELQARARIGHARGKGWNVKNTEFRTFQLFEGKYRGRYQ